tara:strand:+ start:1031 stop:1630 length:600 start_codon:yes stop_codon:yes gene_type:complete
MKENPNYYAIIPSEVRYADITPNAKLLYAEISALTNMNGKCNASTNYFAKLYKVSKTSIQNWLKCLEDNKFITRKNIYKEGSKEILSRYIKLFEYSTQDKLRDNNNITYSNNNLTDSKARFKKPTVNDIKEYCLWRNNGIDSETFFDFYESKDWKVGKNKMKDWKACIRTWEKRQNKTNNNNTTSHRHQKGGDYGDGKF